MLSIGSFALKAVRGMYVGEIWWIRYSDWRKGTGTVDLAVDEERLVQEEHSLAIAGATAKGRCGKGCAMF